MICYEARGTTESLRRITSRVPCKRCRFASIVFVVRHLGNLGRRKFTVQVVSSRGSTTLRYIKSPREKLWSPRGVSRRNTKRPRDPSFPAQCAGARRLSARLHFETLSKLGNCIKSDLYLSVPGILVPREVQRHKFRATQRALSSITGSSTSVSSLRQKII